MVLAEIYNWVKYYNLGQWIVGEIDKVNIRDGEISCFYQTIMYRYESHQNGEWCTMANTSNFILHMKVWAVPIADSAFNSMWQSNPHVLNIAGIYRDMGPVAGQDH